MTLFSDHLNRTYAERIGVQHPDVKRGVSAFASLMTDAPDLRDALKAERARLVDKIVERCYMSRIRRGVIDEALRRLDREEAERKGRGARAGDAADRVRP